MTMRLSRSASPFCHGTLLLIVLLAALSPKLAHAREGPKDKSQPSVVVVEAEAVEAETEPPCEEMYVVGEGETLHSISAKCNDPYIMEENPYIADDGDVYPGLVLRITTPARHQEHLLLQQ